MSVPGKATYTVTGEASTDAAQTHLDIGESNGTAPTVTHTFYKPYGQPTTNGAPDTLGAAGYLGQTHTPAGNATDAVTGGNAPGGTHTAAASSPGDIVHLDHRDYPTALGRLTAPDPLFDLADPQTLNPYSYADNNPITGSDPSGLMCQAGDYECGGAGETSGNGGRSGSGGGGDRAGSGGGDTSGGDRAGSGGGDTSGGDTSGSGDASGSGVTDVGYDSSATAADIADEPTSDETETVASPDIDPSCMGPMSRFPSGQGDCAVHGYGGSVASFFVITGVAALIALCAAAEPCGFAATEAGSAEAAAAADLELDSAAEEVAAASTESDVVTGTNTRGLVNSRGSFRKGTLSDAWDNADPGPSGGRLCPTCGEEVSVEPNSGVPRDWDGSHNPSWTNREFPGSISRSEVLDNYNTGVSLECPECNRLAGNNDSRFGQ